MAAAVLRLKKHEDRRLREGHLWVFSNEVDIQATPLSGFAPGDPAVIESASGKVLGAGYVNPHALICARIVSRDPATALDRGLLVQRFKHALALRQQLFPDPYYRLVYGDSDGLPGLVVDRYDDVFVVQIATAGMERVKQEIVAALERVCAPRAVLLRNDGGARELEGLEKYIALEYGALPPEVMLQEHGVRFKIPVTDGQKTGWYYDQRMNRQRLRSYVAGKRVLDVFSYLGAWGVQAAFAGADTVTCVDSSARALEWLQENAALNNVTDKITTLQADAFIALQSLRAQATEFDVAIVDPPAFIKRKKDIKEGTQAYRRVNQMAMRLLAPGGILISSSCSYHLPRAALAQALLQAGRPLQRELQIIEQGHQAPDHPVHPAIPETDYLKVYFSRVDF